MYFFKERLRQIMRSMGIILFSGWLAISPNHATAAVLTFKNEKTKKVQLLIKNNNMNLSDDDVEQIASAHILASEKYGINLATGLAISFKESTFYPSAVSYDGVSVGLMMVNRKVWIPKLKLDRIKLREDVHYNVDAGYRILKIYQDLYGQDQGIKKYRGSVHQSTNTKYYNSIMSLKAKFEKWLVFDPEPAG